MHGSPALSLTARAEVAELVDALDLGSSGAIRGGSSPPFRTNFISSQRSPYEKERSKRDSRFLEEEKGIARARSGAGNSEAATRSKPASARRKTTGHFDEIGTSRFLNAKGRLSRAGLFFRGRFLDFRFDVDAGFGERGEKVVGIPFLIQGPLQQLSLVVIPELTRVCAHRAVPRDLVVLDVLRF